jgi:pSer/pThr/pTyr-binding forkhead associated (FHA) protein
MRATLIVVGGKANKGQVSLELPIVIGRSRSADLTVAHPMISRRHCEIYDSSGLVMVRDLDSLNGTLVAGRKISEAALRPDDEFTVGPLTFRVDYEYSARIEMAGEDSPLADVSDQPPVEITHGGSESEEPTPPPPVVVAEIPSELEETLPEDEGSGIAPRDGHLPDLSEWPDPSGGVNDEPDVKGANDLR